MEQVLAVPSDQYFELLGVTEDTPMEEMRTQYKQLALLVHPDKNLAPGAPKAFQILKRAFDAISSGADPEDADTRHMACPNPECDAVVYMERARYKAVLQGQDVGVCRACQHQFARLFCAHCFASWIMVVQREHEGRLVTCSGCARAFAVQFPRAQSGAHRQSLRDKLAHKRALATARQQHEQQLRRKRNWWEAPADAGAAASAGSKRAGASR